MKLILQFTASNMEWRRLHWYENATNQNQIFIIHVTSGGAHLRGLAREQHSPEKMSQPW